MLTRRKINLMETTTEKIGRMLSDNYGIKVVYSGDKCCTNGKTIFLPVLGEDAPDDLVAAFPGLIDHETSHVMDTDFAIFEGLENDPDGPKLHPILNGIEDARCEKFITDRWRGTRVNLAKTHEWGFKKLFEDWEGLHEWIKFVQMLNTLANEGADHWSARKMEELDPELWAYTEAVKDMLSKAATLKNTQESLDLAKEVLEKIHLQTDPPPPPPPQGGQGDDDDESDSEDGESDSESSGNKPQQQGGEDEEDGSEGGSESTDEQEGEEDDDQDKQDSGGSQSQQEEDEHPESLKRDWKPGEEEKQQEKQTSLENQITKAAKLTKQASARQYLVFTTEGDTIETAIQGDRVAVKKLLTDHRHVVHVTKQKMMRNLVAMTKCRWKANQEFGTINPRDIPRIITGTVDKPFRKRTEALKFDTRASLWIDHSYSMEGDKLRTAAASAIIFGEVLNLLRIPFEVCGYSTGFHLNGHHRYGAASQQDKMVYTRWGDLWVKVYKGFDEDWGYVKHRCSNMRNSEKYNTYDGESVRLAARRLLMYPERRRILFVFNDGQPYPNVDTFAHVHRDYLKDVVEEVERHIELFAIGIRSDTVGNYYSNAVSINSVSDLPKVMIGKLDQLLKKMQRQLLSRVA